jgi:hypothetical protein
VLLLVDVGVEEVDVDVDVGVDVVLELVVDEEVEVGAVVELDDEEVLDSVVSDESPPMLGKRLNDCRA